jgi:hypothetical protein
MRTQAKPFIVQVRKRKRRGVGDPHPPTSLFGPAETKLFVEAARESRPADGTFSRGSERGSGDQPNHDGAGARPVAGWSAWPAPSNGGAAIVSSTARVLPDLSQRDRPETVQVVKPPPRIRRKRRAAVKPVEAASGAADVADSKTDLPSLAPVTDAADTAGGAQKRTRRQRLKWSAWRVRRGKTDPGTPVTRLGQRWKRRLPKTSR